MKCKEHIILDAQSELDTTDFTSEKSKDDSYQYFIDQLDIHYRDRDVDDNSVDLKDIAYIMNIFDTLELDLDECYFEIIKYLEGK